MRSSLSCSVVAVAAPMVRSSASESLAASADSVGGGGARSGIGEGIAAVSASMRFSDPAGR